MQLRDGWGCKGAGRLMIIIKSREPPFNQCTAVIIITDKH